jgi:NAD(P)-dependent dehydrogenase (short-subunit alcohol dehydrogenase family)
MMRKSIVITGCSSGFGRATALELATRGWHVFATVRKEEDCASLLDEATLMQCCNNITPLLCDITQSEQVAALGQKVEELLRAELAAEQSNRMPGLDALLNNAGTAYAGPIELVSLDDMRAQFEINVFAHIAVTQALLPLLKTAKGTIINVSSISGRISVPITGLYSGSKYALEGISDALRLELAHFGVRVVMIEPASSPTSIWKTSLERSQQHLGDSAEHSAYIRLVEYSERMANEFGRKGFPVRKFVDVVIKILESPRPRARYGVPGSATTLMLLRRLTPDFLWDAIIRLAMRW